MNMKKLIESMDHIEECGMVDEGPMAAMAPPAPEMDKGNPVTVNVSMNASGKEHVADLLDMMKNAGLGGAEEVSPKMLTPRDDMERLAGIMDNPAIPGKDDVPGDADVDDSSCMDDIDADEAYSPGDENAEGVVSNCCSAPVQDEREGTGRCSACGEGCEAVAEEAVEEADYANEPDPQYGDMSDAIPDGNDLNRKKKSYPATQDGDNPMAVEAIKATLLKALAEKKMPMGAGPDGKKGTDDDKPAFLDQKKGDKKSKGGSKPKKGVVPPQFKKKGTDEGVATKDCPKCGAPGKKKLMACSSCGCS